MWALIDIVGGVCARCGQAFCVEKRRGEAIVGDLSSPQVVDRACRICGCTYSRQVDSEAA
jgi:hypothetical protein